MRASESQRRDIQSEIESIRMDKARLMDAMIATTARVQEAERGVAAADEQLDSLNIKADALSRSLGARRGAIVEILAAVQRMGANPPPAILIRSGDMAEAVRAATLLSAMTVNLKAETERLAHDVADLSATRTTIAEERQRHADAVVSLTNEKARLAALVDARAAVPGLGGGGARLAAEAGGGPRQPGRDAQGPDRPNRGRGGSTPRAGAGGARRRRTRSAGYRSEGGKSAGGSTGPPAPGSRVLRRQRPPATSGRRDDSQSVRIFRRRRRDRAWDSCRDPRGRGRLRAGRRLGALFRAL